jgi:hypothetical protein
MTPYIIVYSAVTTSISLTDMHTCFGQKKPGHFTFARMTPYTQQSLLSIISSLTGMHIHVLDNRETRVKFELFAFESTDCFLLVVDNVPQSTGQWLSKRYSNHATA